MRASGSGDEANRILEQIEGRLKDHIDRLVLDPRAGMPEKDMDEIDRSSLKLFCAPNMDICLLKK